MAAQVSSALLLFLINYQIALQEWFENLK
jgi:hypothetical protein